MGTQRSRVRVEQTYAEWESLRQEVEAWFDQRRDKPEYQQYATQLKALQAVLRGAAARLRDDVSGVNPAAPPGQVYAACHQSDLRLVWLRRIWEYYRRKFEQREAGPFREVLLAADEVVWSCYSEAFRNLGRPQGAAPLPYLEPFYSPRAIPRAEPPPELRRDVDRAFLQACLAFLPIPLVSLPPACVNAPWWLAYIAHEVGHHVQYDLLPGNGLVDAFSQVLKKAARNDPEPRCDAAGAQQWAGWGMEIFADIYSVLCLGPAAVWAMSELEMREEADMLQLREVTYPLPIVRLALMAETANVLDPLRPTTLRDLAPDQLTGEADSPDPHRRAAAFDLRVMPKIVAAALSQDLAGLGSLRQFVEWRTRRTETGEKSFVAQVAGWADGLRGRSPRGAEESLTAPRLIISAAVAAWAEIEALPGDQERAAAREGLAKALPRLLAASREGGTRAGELAPAAEPDDLAGRLASALLGATQDQLAFEP